MRFTPKPKELKTGLVEIPKVANDTSKVAEKFAQPQTATVAKPSFARRTNVTTKSEPNFP